MCRLLVDETISHFLSHYFFKKQKEKKRGKEKTNGRGSYLQNPGWRLKLLPPNPASKLSGSPCRWPLTHLLYEELEGQ